MPEPAKTNGWAVLPWVLAGLLGIGAYAGSGPEPVPVCPCATPVAPAVAPAIDPNKLAFSIEGEKTCAPGDSIELRAEGNADQYVWASEAAFKGPYESGKVIVFSTATPGRYVFWLFGSNAKQAAKQMHAVIVGTPEPPKPIDPPKPVDPPTPAPQPGKISVLVVEEVDERTPEFSMVQGSWPLRDYLNTHTEKGVGNRPCWLWTDKDVDTAKLPKIWQDAMKLPRQSVPWIVVLGPGGQGVLFSGPVPKKLEDVMVLLKKYGGE